MAEERRDHILTDEGECVPTGGKTPFGWCHRCNAALILTDGGRSTRCPNGHDFYDMYDWPRPDFMKKTEDE